MNGDLLLINLLAETTMETLITSSILLTMPRSFNLPLFNNKSNPDHQMLRINKLKHNKDVDAEIITWVPHNKQLLTMVNKCQIWLK